MVNDLTIYLIRHGESVQNTKPDLIGQDPNELLSERGQKQALILGDYFKSNNIVFDNVFCSPYTRAVQTETNAGRHFKYLPTYVPALREYSAGDMTGCKRSEVMTETTIAAMSTLGMLFRFPNGESLYDVQQRALTWMESSLLNNPAVAGQKVAFFSHGMTIKCILQYVMKFDQHLTWRMKIDNTSTSVIRIKDGLWFVDSINDTRHLT